MPNEQTDAIVLRTTNFADQDKIVVFFSPDRGLLRGVAKGARKFGNRFGSSLEPMSVVRVFYHEKERRDFVTVASCDLVESFFDVQKDPETAFLLTYFAELIEEFAPARAAEEVLYRLLLAVLRCLGQGGDRAFLAAYFEAWFLQANGLLPDLAGCRACRKPLAAAWLSPKRDGAYCPDCAPLKKEELPSETGAFVRWARKNPPPGVCAPPFGPDEVARIRKTLQAMIVYHMDREPRTLQFIK